MSIVNNTTVTVTSGVGDVTYTAGAGSDRVVVAMIPYEESFNGRNFTDVKLGSQSLTPLVQHNYLVSTSSAYVDIWYLKEVDIPSGAQTVTTANPAANEALIEFFTIDNANQTPTITATDGNTSDTALSALVTSSAGDTVLATASYVIQSQPFDSWLNSFTEVFDLDGVGTFRGTVAYKVATGSETASVTNSESSATNEQALAVVVIEDLGAATPTITTIAPDPATTGAELAITGTGFEAAQGTGGVTQSIDGQTEALTETAWSDTSITSDSSDIEAGTLKYGTQTLEVTADGGGSDTITFEADPETDNAYVNLTSIEAVAANRITAIGDLAIGDQLRYASVTTPGGYAVTVNADATFSISGSAPDGNYTFEVNSNDDAGDRTWGTPTNQNVTIGTPAGGTATYAPKTRLNIYRQ